ncbi:MAG: hypothetical protein WA746_13480 [Isosphaeraceae bacterium]
MSRDVDWSWKLREAVDRIRTRYDHIGRKTGAPFLAVVYPPEAEVVVLKEWRTLVGTLGAEFDVRTIDVLDVTSSVIDELGVDNIVEVLANPMPGASPEVELGSMWASALAERVKKLADHQGQKKTVVVLERLAALYPATGPRSVMQSLWDSEQEALEGPVIVLIPGTLIEARVYLFLDQREEFMYRGDIL